MARKKSSTVILGNIAYGTAHKIAAGTNIALGSSVYLNTNINASTGNGDNSGVTWRMANGSFAFFNGATEALLALPSNATEQAKTFSHVYFAYGENDKQIMYKIPRTAIARGRIYAAAKQHVITLTNGSLPATIYNQQIMDLTIREVDLTKPEAAWNKWVYSTPTTANAAAPSQANTVDLIAAVINADPTRIVNAVAGNITLTLTAIDFGKVFIVDTNSIYGTLSGATTPSEFNLLTYLTQAIDTNGYLGEPFRARTVAEAWQIEHYGKGLSPNSDPLKISPDNPAGADASVAYEFIDIYWNEQAEVFGPTQPSEYEHHLVLAVPVTLDAGLGDASPTPASNIAFYNAGGACVVNLIKSLFAQSNTIVLTATT